MGYLTTYLGSAPTTGISGTARTVTDYTATAGQTVFSAIYAVGYVDVYQNGAKLAVADYTATNGTSITLATGAALGDLIEIVGYSTLNVAASITSDTFSGNGSTTAFTMTSNPSNSNSVLVVISGVTQDPSSYTVSGTTLTFSTAPPAGTNNISARYLGLPSTTSVSSFSGGTTGLTPSTSSSGAITLGGTLAVANGGTGQTSFTAGQIHYGSFSTSANLYFDGTNLGVGTSSPTAKLDVRGSGYFINSSNPTSFWSVDSGLTTGSGYCQWNTSANEFRVESYTSHPLVFGTANLERMRIKSTGDIKIVAGNLLGWSDYSAGVSGVGVTAITSPNENLLFYSTGTERMRLDSSGNVGIGVVPAASTIAGLQFSTNAIISGSANTYISNNAVYNSGWKYVAASNATMQYQMSNSGHLWYTAPSGTAGSAISFNQAMALDVNGMLSIGGVTPYSGASVYPSIFFGYGNQSLIGAQGTTFGLYTGLYYSSGWKFSTTGNQGAGFVVREGYFQWYNTNNATGTAGGTANVITSMVLDNTGNLTVNGANYNTASQTSITITDHGNNAAQGSIQSFIQFKGRYWSGDDNTADLAKIAMVKDSADGNTGAALGFYTQPQGGSATLSAYITGSGNLQFNSGYGSVATAYGVRAWVNFNGVSGASIRASGNVSSVTRNGTGDYTMNFTNAMPDANYVLFGTAMYPNATNQHFIALGDNNGASGTLPTASAVRFQTIYRASGAQDCTYVEVAVIR